MTRKAHFAGLPDRKFDAARIADVREAGALLGWRARVGLADGLTRTVAWFRDRRSHENSAAGDVTAARVRGI